MQRIISSHHTTGSTVGITELLAIIRAILQRPGEFFNEIRDNIDLMEKIQALLITSILFLAIYGAVLGSGHPLQALSSAIKLPLVFLGSLVACAPTLYVFDLLLGSKRSLHQTIAVLLTSITATAVLLFSFTSITIAFRLMFSDYQFFNLLNVGFLVITVAIGVLYMVTGLSRSSGVKSHLLNDLFYTCWIILFLFMVSQIAWSLRPFFYYPDIPFALFAGGGNLFTGIFNAIGEFLGFGIVR